MSVCDRVLAQALGELVGRVGQARRSQCRARARRTRRRSRARRPRASRRTCRGAPAPAQSERALTCRRAPRATRSRASPSSCRERARALGVGEQRAHARVLEAPQAVLEHGSRDVGRGLDEQRAAAVEREALGAGREHVVEPAGVHLGAREHAGRRRAGARAARARARRSRRAAASKRASTCGVVTTVVAPCCGERVEQGVGLAVVAGPSSMPATTCACTSTNDRICARAVHGSPIDANGGGLEGWS